MKVEFKKTLSKQLQKIQKNDQNYILKFFESFIHQEDNLDIKKMESKEGGCFRLRVGNFRLVFQTKRGTVVFLKVDRRDSVYFDF